MPTLNTGNIIVGAYADKVRRTLFALANPMQKEGAVTSEQIAYGAAVLNQLLYKILVENLKCDKGDVVRIVIDFDIRDGKIVWNYDTLKVEWFVRQDQSKVDEIVNKIIKESKEIS